jgi:glycosyltransferase involved in cell wall biosynthesis
VQEDKKIIHKIDRLTRKNKLIDGIIFCGFSFNYVNLGNVIISIINKLFQTDIKKKSRQHPTQLFDKDRILKLKKAIENISPDIIICNYVHSANIIEYIDKNIYSFIITHDILSKRQKILGQQQQKNIKYWTKENEIYWLRKADCIIAIQDMEKEEFRQMCINTKVITLMPPITPYIQKKPPARNVKQILFVGSNNYFNQNGIRWFLDNAFDACYTAQGIRLVVCGAICEFLKDDERVQAGSLILKGKVDDLTPEYVQAGVVIIPMLYGTGLKIKLVEALQYGCPVITTSCGAEGLQGIHGFCGLVADSPADFAKGIIDLLKDEATHTLYSENAATYIKSAFNPARTLEILQTAIEEESHA